MVKPEVCGLGPSHAFLMDPQYTVNYREYLDILLPKATVAQHPTERLHTQDLCCIQSWTPFTGFPLEMEMTQKSPEGLMLDSACITFWGGASFIRTCI